MINVKDIWNSQFTSLKNEVIRYYISEIINVNCYIGTISISKAKFFTLEIESNIKIHPNNLKRFIGVEVQILPSINNKKELTIILLEEELSEIFILFIEDVIKSLAVVTNSEEALLIVSNRINYWRKLFGKYSTGLLTPEQQRGLFGELYFINKLLQSSNKFSQIINAWQAPTWSNQDFYFNGTAVEVKTSKSNNATIKISNEFQLDSTGLNDLFIAFYKLNVYPDDNHTLLSIIKEIRKVLCDDIELLKLFNSKIEGIGLIPDTEEEYNNIGFFVRDEKYYKVSEDFPKIIKPMVKEEISKISYEISPIDFDKFEKEYNILKIELLND